MRKLSQFYAQKSCLTRCLRYSPKQVLYSEDPDEMPHIAVFIRVYTVYQDKNRVYTAYQGKNNPQGQRYIIIGKCRYCFDVMWESLQVKFSKTIYQVLNKAK